MAVIFTVGHSTHPIEEFIALLRAHDVTRVVDVRTIARSRHDPQFGAEQLVTSLPAAGIGYGHLASLGGLRHARKDSVNGAWRNASFRGYADYMQTPEFAAGIEELLELAGPEDGQGLVAGQGLAAGPGAAAIMCAEAVPWRCHRSLIGDALLVRGVEVLDIFSPTSVKPHRLTSFAVVDGLSITYPA